jgi:hypothetical protein
MADSSAPEPTKPTERAGSEPTSANGAPASSGEIAGQLPENASVLSHEEAKTAFIESLAEPEEVKQKEDDRKKEKKKRKKLGSKRGVETMFRTSYLVHMDLSSLADAKANIMISINGIIVSIMLASIAPQATNEPKMLIPTTAMILTCLISLVFAVLAARPRVTKRSISLEDVRTGGANILFFGNFSNMTRADFEVGMADLMRDKGLLYFNMIRDIYGLGAVLQKKFTLLRVAYNVFMVGLIISISLFIGIFIWISLQG